MKESVLSQEMQDTLEQLFNRAAGSSRSFFHLLFCSSTADKKNCQKKADTYVSSYYMPIVQRVFI